MERPPTVDYESAILRQRMLGSENRGERYRLRDNPVFHLQRHIAPGECRLFRWVECTLGLLPNDD